MGNTSGMLGKSKVNYGAVREDLKEMMNNPDWDDGSYAPLLIRLGWHSSGTYDASTKTGGSNGATMRFSPESDDPENNGLAKAREILEPIKKKHSGISYADLWILAAYVSIEVTGGPVIEFRPGRIDKKAKEAIAPGRLPEAEHGLEKGLDSEGRTNGWENLSEHIRKVFGRMGLSDQEAVALISGGHVYGRCHPEHTGYAGAWVEDPTLFTNEYAADLVEDEWMYVENDTTVDGEPIPEETRPAVGKRQYMTKWEPTKVEELQNSSPDLYPPGKYKVSVGWINVRRSHLPDSYVIDQPKKGTEFNIINVRQFNKGVRGQLDVGGWASILSTNGEDVLMERTGEVALETGKYRLLPGAAGTVKLYSNAPGTVEEGATAESSGVLQDMEVQIEELQEVKNEKNAVVEVYGKLKDGSSKGLWAKVVDVKLGALFERVVDGYNPTPRKPIKKLQVQYQMMLPSDMVMLWDDGFRTHLEKYAKDEDLLKKDFGVAYKKLTELGVFDD